MRKKPTRKRPYFTMESAMTAILRDTSGKMHLGYYSIVVKVSALFVAIFLEPSRNQFI